MDLQCQVGTTFRKVLYSAHKGEIFLNTLFVSDGSQKAADLCFCAFDPFFFILLPLLCQSSVTGTYLWDICRKVGISMWKGSCRQCYALCIHSICMKCSRCHSCSTVIYRQYFRQCRRTIRRRHIGYSCITSTSRRVRDSQGNIKCEEDSELSEMRKPTVCLQDTLASGLC